MSHLKPGTIRKARLTYEGHDLGSMQVLGAIREPDHIRGCVRIVLAVDAKHRNAAEVVLSNSMLSGSAHGIEEYFEDGECVIYSFQYELRNGEEIIRKPESYLKKLAEMWAASIWWYSDLNFKK